MEINAKLSNPLQWLPRCLAGCAQGSWQLCPLWHLSTLRVGRSGTTSCVLGLMEICTLRMLFLLEDTPKVVFALCVGDSQT